YSCGPRFEQENISDQWSVGGSVFYNWHPLTSTNSPALKQFFTRFALGGEFNRYGSNDQFLFNAQVLLGYSFKFDKICLDVYTGPTGKFAPRVRSFTGPYGYVYDSDYLPELDLPRDKSELPVWTIKMYTGGVYWTFGVGLRINHFGINLGYNQSLSDFERFRRLENSQYIKYWSNPLLNSMTAGLQYFF
ncbi:MAG: hypothetical protein K2K84_09135, partial [Muribaculaceae bacterium]|nr:hypothetical protein [Muribaculaceae bacterium]